MPITIKNCVKEKEDKKNGLNRVKNGGKNNRKKKYNRTRTYPTFIKIYSNMS